MLSAYGQIQFLAGSSGTQKTEVTKKSTYNLLRTGMIPDLSQNRIKDPPKLDSSGRSLLLQKVFLGIKTSGQNINLAQSDRTKMDKLIQANSTVIMRLSTVFPLDLFPKELVIDLNKVSVFNHQLADIGQVNSTQIQDIADINVETGLFFAKISIYDKNFKDQPLELDYLPKKQTIRAKRILLGLNMTHRKKIDLTSFSPEEIVQKVEQLGTLHIPEVDNPST